ncbi:MAG: Sec-independent protein translocase protein TatB, partial [Burkholderiales bacterium]
MFDVGLSEIMVIAVVALIVLGPEKLPKTARTLGHLFGRLQRYVSDVKADINRELELEELKKMQAEVKTAASEFESSLTTSAQEVEANVRAVEASLNAAAADGNAVPAAESAPAAGDSTAVAAAASEAPQGAPAAQSAVR